MVSPDLRLVRRAPRLGPTSAPAPAAGTSTAAAGLSAAPAAAGSAALRAPILRQRLHREAALEGARVLALAARGPLGAAPLVAVVLLEVLLHRVGQQIDDVLELADPLGARDFLL